MTEDGSVPDAVLPLVRQACGDDTIRVRTKVLAMHLESDRECVISGDFEPGNVLSSMTRNVCLGFGSATVGPIAYDYGTMLGSLVLAFLAQPYLNPGNTHIQSDIMTGVRDMWQAFSGELARQCDIASRDDMAFSSFLSSVEYDSIGYAACELADMAWGRTTPSEVASLSDEQRALVTKDAALAIMSMMGRMMTMDDLLGCLSSHVER